MKAILISIKPKYCELIANGKKTVEVRKTKPKIEVPFKCYIYCTQEKYKIDALHILPNGKIEGWQIERANIFGEYCNGKVIGEFVCDRIDEFSVPYPAYFGEIDSNTESIIKSACLKPMDIHAYNGTHQTYGWHISNLVIYDKPKELFDFANYNKYQVCKEKNCFSDNCWICPNNAIVTRPFQSWGYIEDLGV